MFWTENMWISSRINRDNQQRDKREKHTMKIIVTGGASFIGGNFVHHMVNKYPEYQIINLDLLHLCREPGDA